jgi:hypothetical protein
MSNIYDKASLVLIPSGTKTSKIFSQKPVNGDGDFTFSRSTAATRVNADGNIEKETQNLLLQSNSFDTTWNTFTASITGGQTGYDNSSDAWLLDVSVANGSVYQSINQSNVLTASIYAKKGTANGIRFRMDHTSDTNVYVDLRDGSLSSSSNSIDINIQDAGNGWYRISVAFSAVNMTTIVIYPTDGNTASTAGSIYIQDAQLEQGLVARDYIETTTAAVEGGITDNVPRLDYTDSSCPALLLEPQRTNFVAQSEYFGASWGASNITITSNATTSPEGVNNATLLANTSGSNYLVYSASVSASTTYQFSFYAKNVDATNVDVLFYDVSNNAIISTTAYEGDLTTEWKRLDFSVTTPVGCTSLGVNILYSLSGSLYAYGAQLEAGNYSTSLIPTYGTSVTRDVEQLYTLEDSSLFDLEQGTFFLEMSALEDDGTDRKISISDGTNDNMVNIGFSRFTGNINGEVISNGVLQTSGFAAIGVTQTNNNKFALVWGNGEFRFYVNGVKTKESSISNSPVGMDILRFAQGNGSQRPFLNNKQLLVFPTALTDQEAIDLTTI